MFFFFFSSVSLSLWFHLNHICIVSFVNLDMIPFEVPNSEWKKEEFQWKKKNRISSANDAGFSLDWFESYSSAQMMRWQVFFFFWSNSDGESDVIRIYAISELRESEEKRIILCKLRRTRIAAIHKNKSLLISMLKYSAIFITVPPADDDPIFDFRFSIIITKVGIHFKHEPRESKKKKSLDTLNKIQWTMVKVDWIKT